MQGNRLRERCVHPVSIRNVWIKGTERCLVHHLHFLFCPYSLGPWLRFPHPWEIAFLFFFFLLCLYWIYCNIASVLCFEVFGHEACGILVPWLGIEPTPLALGGEVLTSGLSGKSSFFFPGPGILARGAKWWPRKRVLWVYPESHSGA